MLRSTATRHDGGRRTRLTRGLLWLGLTLPTPLLAAIGLDLSYVDRGGAAYQRFKTYVDAAVAGRPGYAFSPLDAVFMARLDGNPAYCQLAVQLVEQQVSAAEARIAQGQRPAVSFDSYLEAGDLIGALAFTFDGCAAAMSAAQRARWAAYAEQAVWNIWNPSQARWGATPHPWSGWSINDPGNNYYYSFVEATMSWALASDSANWLRFLREVKLPALVQVFDGLPGGGSPEGTGYGTAHMRLFWLYRLWRDATGEDLAAANRHVDDTILYWIHATLPSNDRFAPIGDQARSSQPVLYDYQRRLMLEARALTGDPLRRRLASGWLNRIAVRRMESGFNYRHDLLAAGNDTALPESRFHHASGTGHLFARSDWSNSALWLAMVAGPFEQSHAHEDQGSFTLFRGDWLTVTANIWSHSGIQQGSEVHNVLRFERQDRIVRQRRGTRSTMVVADGGAAGLRVDADLTRAYGPNAPVRHWQRTLRFSAGQVEVHDDYAVDSDTRAVFQLNFPLAPLINGTRARAGDLEVEVIEPAGATLSAVHWPTVDSDVRSGWRLDIAGGAGRYVVRLKTGASLFRDGFDIEP